MRSSRLKVSVGVPVYNGENYLAACLDSLLAQSFGDFEIIISDNASTDRTGEIAQAYASKHKHIKYFRQSQNCGSAANFNRCFKLASGQYFKWQAHDDLLAPHFLEECVKVLDQKPEVVLVFPATQVIDAEGNSLELHRIAPDTQAPSPVTRFTNLMLGQEGPCYELYGLIRSKALFKTDLMGSHAVAERTLLAQLALQGPFKQIPDPLFFARRHKAQSSWNLTTQHERLPWVDPLLEGRTVFPQWRAFGEFQKSLLKSSLPATSKLYSQLYFLKYLKRYRQRMTNDLRLAWNRTFRRNETDS